MKITSIAKRYLEDPVHADLREKMVFIGGPRQVGKTTLAKKLLSSFKGQYLNWDDTDDRQRILAENFSKETPLLVFDEIHKFARWRRLVKGIYDKYSPDTKLLVTGSARLDILRKGGDSLVGRYHYHRLHPLSVAELRMKTKEDVQSLLRFGGFPEPFFRQSEIGYRRWSNERVARVTTQDLRDIETVKDLSLVELLISMLPPRVGSLLSVRGLQEDLSVSPNTVIRWVEILERLYYCFRIPPFGGERAKAVKKAQKLYLWDWAETPEGGARFENFVASHLLKYCHHQEDTLGDKMELRFYRDSDGREVDFVVLQNRRPLFAVECKSGGQKLSLDLNYLQTHYRVDRVFQTHLGNSDFGHEAKGGRVIPFAKLSATLGLS